MSTNNYFCVLPFFGYEFVPSNPGSHCCLLPKDYNIDQLRRDMLAGQRSKFCSACWDLEDAGLVSDRKLKNSALDHFLDRDIRLIEEDARQGRYKTIMVKHTTSNTCNSTCVTCSSRLSSAWAPLAKAIGLVPYPPQSSSKLEIDKNLNYSELVTINFVGGEPLYEKLNFYILEQLLKHNNPNCFIAITTNGSTILTDYQKSVISKFKNLNFNLSIDGVGPVFEYMRFPLRWDSLKKNLEFFRSITDNVSASYTTSNLNVLYHHETVAWFNENQLKYHFNPVFTPEYFQPSALPLHVKEHILSKYNYSNDLKFFIGKPHSDQDDLNFKTMLEKIAIQDKVKGIQMKDYLPEFHQLINP